MVLGQDIMHCIQSRKGFTRIDALFAAVVCGLLLALLLPAVQHAREASRLESCKNRTRLLVQATLDRVDATNRFPLAMYGGAAEREINNTSPVPFTQEDGYSWTVSILPFMKGKDEFKLYNDLTVASEDFSLPMNSDTLKRSGEWLHARPIEQLLCPSFPPEKHTIAGKHPGLSGGQVSNYLALAAGCVQGPRQTYADSIHGGILTTWTASPKGFKRGDITGGSSSTILLAESKAELYSYWFSGRSTATVALPPDLVTCKTLPGFPKPGIKLVSAINYGRDRQASENSTAPWFARKYPPGPQDWGISSSHKNGSVVHGYADGHVETLNKSIDARVYLSLVTRAGN